MEILLFDEAGGDALIITASSLFAGGEPRLRDDEQRVLNGRRLRGDPVATGSSPASAAT